MFLVSVDIKCFACVLACNDVTTLDCESFYSLIYLNP